MKLSEKWLRDWVNPDADTETLVSQLTMAGLEVDGTEPVAGEFSGVVVGHVLEVEQHPDADKLRVTKVDAGGDEPLQIVCGAPNVHVGMRAPCAVVGAVLPGIKIKKAKLRGVQSMGMLCSAKELGLAESADGLMPLPGDAPVGQDIREYLDLDDTSIDIDLTPNRGDCLSVAGIAREVGVLNSADLTPPPIDPVAAHISDTFPVALDSPTDCPRYVGRVIRGIDPAAETPLWMVERLRRSGVRSLGPGVDVTNYVLLELGQPMHAFDLAKLSGGIVVRRAAVGEQLTLLDGKVVELGSDTLVIADAGGPLAMAGIMGGEHSGVTDGTRDIFLESAHFAPEVIAGRARKHGLHTDASHRFERGVDPHLCERAMERATTLILEICGGEAGPVIDVSDPANLPHKAPVHLRRDRIARLLGIDFEDARVEEYLTRLGMAVEQVDDGWKITPPSFRFDIAIEADLIEELGRLHGYDNIPTSMPHAETVMAHRPENQSPIARLRSVLVDRGYQEAITYSFIDPRLHGLFDHEHEGVALANPLSADLSIMRTSLWPGLVNAMRHNLNRQQSRVRLFETGMVFVQEGDELVQVNRIAGVATGDVNPEQWGEKARRVDYYDVKGDLEALFGTAEGYGFVSAQHPALHPGQTARIEYQGRGVGWLGVLHPATEKALGLDAPAVVFELDLATVEKARVPAFAPLSRFPSIRRDLAVLVDESVSADALIESASSVDPLVAAASVFDIYRGKGIETGLKSVAMSLILLDSSRTLTDQDVDRVIGLAVENLRDKHGAQLRD
ncbi:MAG: phenylalanine--tRNA ligase subunit beta [Gammaproteobacteria bacterium]